MARSILISRRDFFQDPLCTVSGGAWLTDFSVLRDPRPQTCVQARSPEPEDTTFTVDLGAQRTVSLFHFQNLRVTALGIIRLQAGTDPTFSVMTYDSGTVSAWPADKSPGTISPWGELSMNGLIEPEEYVALGLPRYFIPPVPVNCRYIKVSIMDTTNTVPTQIGCFGACEGWTPSANWDWGWSYTLVDESDIQTVPFGSKYIVQRGRRRRLSLGFSWISETELMRIQFGWMMMIGKSSPIVISVFPDDTPQIEKRAIYGLLSSDPAITNPFFQTYSMPVAIDALI